MVIGIIGESCTWKSTLADRLKTQLGAEVYTGKDYLRLAKNEAIAKRLFQNKLEEAIYGAHIVYVISEMEHLPLLPATAFRILVTAELDVIKERFAKRMRGNLPAPVAMMAPVPGDQLDMSVEESYRKVIDRLWPGTPATERIERFAFYERAKDAFAVVVTGETVKYGNIILKKGVVPVSRDFNW